HGAADCGCGMDGGCGAPYGAPHGGPYGGAPMTERIPPPKDGNLNKMPPGGGGGEPPAKSSTSGGQLQVNVRPAAPIPAAAPALDPAPTGTPPPAANSEERPF